MYLVVKSLAFLVLLHLAGSDASPLPELDPFGNDTLPHSSRITTPFFHGADVCGDSTFEDTTSGTAPLVSDCMIMADNIAVVNLENGSDGGKQTWGVENFFKQQHQLIQFGTCAFGVQGGKVGDAHFWIGNQDIIDLMHTSVARFGASGRVGAKGQMMCKPMGAFPVLVTWGIYHNPK
ncbi:hypothetical protein NKR19_g3316 [Coniochaeta hoffmannii]|uniref:Ecp2 effector protein-like domain-containing protein n=1 Tax=Coniochaeta hoffmannii TaxID=91930 RepID=A0AA38S8Z9_9PEZI|nr:hypothetical protein NKR19_g3316 [Coniochaeta hoffmannii]